MPAAPDPTGAPVKAIKLIERLGYSRHRPGEVMELWFEIRRFAWRRFKVGPGIGTGRDDEAGIFRLYALEFLKSHGHHFFGQERLEVCPEVTVYDCDASADELWQKFKPLGALIWDAKSYKTPPNHRHYRYLGLLQIEQLKDEDEDDSDDDDDGNGDSIDDEDNGNVEDEAKSGEDQAVKGHTYPHDDDSEKANLPVHESPESTALDSSSSKKSAQLPAEEPLAKRKCTTKSAQEIQAQLPTSWDTAIQIEPTRFQDYGLGTGRPCPRRVQIAFVGQGPTVFWPASRKDMLRICVRLSSTGPYTEGLMRHVEDFLWVETEKRFCRSSWDRAVAFKAEAEAAARKAEIDAAGPRADMPPANKSAVVAALAAMPRWPVEAIIEFRCVNPGVDARFEVGIGHGGWHGMLPTFFSRCDTDLGQSSEDLIRVEVRRIEIKDIIKSKSKSKEHQEFGDDEKKGQAT